MANQILFALPRATDANGTISPGAKATFYRTGTTVPVTVYTDELLAVPHATPVVANSGGLFAQVFYGGSTNVKVVVTDSAGSTLYQLDPAPMLSLSGSAAGSVTFSPVSGNAATDVQAAISNNTTALTGKVPNARSISVGTGLTGGGDLSANRSIALAINGTEGPTATTTGTAHDFTTIPATAVAVDVMFNGVSLSGTDHILIQLSTSATFVTTGYNGFWCSFSGTSISPFSAAGGIPVGMGNAARAAYGVVRFTKAPGGNVWFADGGVKHATNEGSTTHGAIDVAGVLDGVRITASGSDTFDAGSVSIMWHL